MVAESEAVPTKIDISEYKRQGFVLCRGLFRAEEVAQVHSEAQEIFAAEMRQKGLLPDGHVSDHEFHTGMFRLFKLDIQAFRNCGKQVHHLISLYRLGVDERVVATVKELGISFPNIGMRPIIFFNHPRLATEEHHWRLPLHQDWRTTQGSLDSATIWLPLVDIDKRLGALEIVPGSHRWGLLPGGRVDREDYVQPKVEEERLLSVEMRRGDALFFSTFLLHRSGTNVTESLRWSCQFRYNNLVDVSFIQRGYPHPFTYKPEPELITPNFPTLPELDEVFDVEGD